jgi:hypothetical protein
MEDTRNWKLKLRYGKETTPFKHFTALGDGVVDELVEGFECPQGPAIMSMKTWASSAGESADMLRVIGGQIGFDALGEIQIYETDPKQPPKGDPYGYDINFTPYDE